MKKHLTYISITLLYIFTINSCAIFNSKVEFEIFLPSKTDLSGVEKLAILDFAVPMGNASYGRIFSQNITQLFAGRSRYEIIPPQAGRSYLTKHRLLPSSLQKSKIIYNLGQSLKAEALLFGDIASIKINKRSEKDTWEEKVG